MAANKPQQVHLRIGRVGLTEGAVKEIQAQIAHIDPFVIKMLPAFCDTNDRKQAAQDIADKTQTRIARLTGGTLILTRKH